jgi:perosamine synthetase
MSIFREIPPTAGFSLHLRDFLSFCKRKNHNSSLADDFKHYLNLDYAKITCSGTAALYLILESLKELSLKKTVIIPAYVCPSVALAILRANLKIEVCDITGYDFNFDPVDLENICKKNRDILAIIPAHLGGIPLDFATIEKIVKKYEIFIIEDCAQALGAAYKGKKVGTLGDFAFFSLARGKGLTIYEGGVIAANAKEYVKIIDKAIEKLARQDFLSEALKILELFGYWIFYRPQLFWFVYRLPELFWNATGQCLKAISEYYTIDSPLHTVSKIRKLVAHVNFYRLDKEIAQQRQKATKYMEGLEEVKGIKIIKESRDSIATYPFLTLIIDEVEKRKKALEVLENSGMGVSQLYTFPITNYEYLKNRLPNKYCPGARYLAERQITLSTSVFLKCDNIASILKTIRNL